MMAGVMKGLDAVREAMTKGVELLKLKSGESKIIRILTPADEIISVYEHTEQFNGSWRTVTCLGKNECPLCQADRRPSYKVYLAVLDRSDDKVKLFKASKKVAMQLLGLIEEYGDLTSRDYKIYRQGEKLDTTYQFFPRDPSPIDLSKYEIPNYEEMVQPLTKEQILELMNGSTNLVEEDSGDADDDDYPF